MLAHIGPAMRRPVFQNLGRATENENRTIGTAAPRSFDAREGGSHGGSLDFGSS